MTPFNSKYRITQAFGINKDYYKQFGLIGHEGLDLVPTGTVWDVFSLGDGVVVLDDDIASATSDPYGKIVTIWHPTLKLATMYCHLASNTVVKGQNVKKGEKIGVMGNSGNSTGAHLHLNLFQTDDNGVRLNKDNGYLGGIDPLPFLQTDDAPTVDFQKELDKLREERDRNHILYQEQIKQREAVEKTLQALNVDYDGVRQELTAYKTIISQYATILGVKPTETEKMSGEIKRLVGIEDNYNSLVKTVDNLMAEVANLQNAETLLKNENNNLVQERDDSRKALSSCIADKGQKQLSEFSKMERFLSLFRK